MRKELDELLYTYLDWPQNNNQIIQKKQYDLFKKIIEEIEALKGDNNKIFERPADV